MEKDDQNVVQNNKKSANLPPSGWSGILEAAQITQIFSRTKTIRIELRRKKK